MDSDEVLGADAETVQREMAERVRIQPLQAVPATVAALDAAYAEDAVCGAAVLFALHPLRLLEERVVVRDSSFPYLPGYFFWREAPALLAALSALPTRPDLLLVEGHGTAHPRRCGIASHIGVVSGIPTIGCAKTRLIGTFEEPGLERGRWSPLQDGETIGAVLRTRTGVKPLFVSPGHLVTLEEAVSLVLHCCGGFRLPEPLRAADMAARKGIARVVH